MDLGDGLKHAQMNDSWRTFLEFHPDNGQWVPLREISWSAHASATKINGDWSIDDDAETQPTERPLTSIETNEFPMWDHINRPGIPFIDE